MRVEDFEDILGRQIPNAMKIVKEMESSIHPIMNSINKHRSEMDPELLKKYDSAMMDIDNAKAKIKENGNFNNR